MVGLWSIILTLFNAGGYLGQHEMMTKGSEMAETLAHGYSSDSTQRELSYEYPHD